MKRQTALLRLFVVAAAVIVWNCSTTEPSEVFERLSIQGPEALRSGESGQFRAVRVGKNGSEEVALAQWSVNGPFMTVQSASGVAVGGMPGIAELRARVGGVSAVRAIRVVPDLRGTWTGAAVLNCSAGNVTRLVGEGPGLCQTPTLTYQVILGVPEHAGEAVAGTFTILGQAIGTFTGGVGIDGSWDWPDFTATVMTESGPYDFILKGWRMTTQTLSGQMSGSGSLERMFTNAWGYQHYRWTAVSLTLQRLTTPQP